MNTILAWMLRLVMLLAAAVFLLSALTALVLILAVWLVAALWAKLTGQPVRPWTFQFDRQTVWNRFSRATRPGHAPRRDDPNVIDVEPKEPKAPKPPQD